MNGILYFIFKLLIISWITAKRQLIHNRTASRNEWNQSYDFIVVGAGAAGCVVANRLAHNNITVLLLEAGGGQDAIYNDIPALWWLIPQRRPDLQWNVVHEPQKYAAKAYPGGRFLQSSGKVLGGSTSHNNMVYNRGNAKIYDEWESKYGAKGWNFKQLLPYFRRSENNTDRHIVEMSPGYHGTNGPIQISTPKAPGSLFLKMKAFFNSLGFMDTDVNGANQTGTMIAQNFINEDGFRWSSSNAYIDPNPYPKNLHIVTEARAYRILLNGLSAVGVEFAKNGNTPFRVYARKEVIISAGAISSPHLLMLSGIGPKEDLTRLNIPVVLDLPVGRNYQEHPQISNHNTDFPDITIKNLEQLFFKRTGLLSQSPNLLLYFSTESNLDKLVPNFYIQFNIYQSDTIYLIPYLYTPKSKGSVRLLSNISNIQPLIDPNFLSDPLDYASAIEGTAFAYFIAEHSSLRQNVTFYSFKELNCPSCPGLKSYQCTRGIKCVISKITRPGLHPCGTCRMADVSRSDAVVDSYLRVKNLKNLRVCDNSIIPRIPSGNSNAAAVMIGEKCAQIIKDCYYI